MCPVQCIYEYDPAKQILFSEEEHGSGVIENTHQPDPDAIAIFGRWRTQRALECGARRAPLALDSAYVTLIALNHPWHDARYLPIDWRRFWRGQGLSALPGPASSFGRLTRPVECDPRVFSVGRPSLDRLGDA